MIKIKPQTRDELLKENAILKEKLLLEGEDQNKIRMEIIKLLFPDNINERDNLPINVYVAKFSWMRISCEIGKLRQSSKEGQMYRQIQEQEMKIVQLKDKIAKLCPDSEDNLIT